VEDIWLFLHLIFEGIWKFRFLYRDVNELLSRTGYWNPLQAHRGPQGSYGNGNLPGPGGDGRHEGNTPEIQALAINMTVVATYWLSFEFVSDPRKKIDGHSLARGAFQVMALAAPYLVGHSRKLFEEVSKNYLTA